MNVHADPVSFETIPDYVLDAIKSGPIPKVRVTTHLADDDLTDGEAVIRFAEENLPVPEGPLVGKPLKLDIYQKVFILAVFDNPDGTSKAMLSVARRNGKTFLVAVILLAFVVGPMRSLNTSMCSGANAQDQAAIAFDLMRLMLDMSHSLVDGVHYKYTESGRRITGLKDYVRYRAISADAKIGHGKAYKIILLDEAGQIEAESTGFTDMLETSMSNYDDALFLIISTQAASDSSYYSQQLDHAEISEDPTIVSHVYTVDKDADLQDETQWVRANPGLGQFVSMKKMGQKAREAKQLPSKANGIMNLNFNMRVSLQALLMSPEVWKKNLRPINEVSRRTAWIDIGLDLSQTKDLTAAVACFRDENGDVNVETHAFAPLFGVKQRALRDKVPYEDWAKNGDLHLTPTPDVDYEWVCNYLALAFAGCRIRSIQLDRWRIDQFINAAKRTDFYKMVPATDEAKSQGWIGVGQGFASMGVRVDAFEREALNGRLRTGGSPALNMGASQAVVGEDPAGNRKPMKNKSVNRIDALVAAIMGVFPNSDGQVAMKTFDVEAMIG